MHANSPDPSFALSYRSPVGPLSLTATIKGLEQCAYGLAAETQEQTSHPVLQKAVSWLDDYFAGRFRRPDFPLYPKGTAFQRGVWQALQAIPAGTTASYRDIAGTIGNPKAFRAVGQANNRNPLAIIIPCHRVVNHNGALGGYAGGPAAKDFLLRLEGGAAYSVR